jgi:outer membrane usher protein
LASLLIVTAVSPALAAGTRTFATFVVNSEDRGEHIVLLKSDGTYAAVADLRASGLSLPQRVVTGAVDGYVRLADLAPEISATFDAVGPTVRLDARNPAFLTQHSDISASSGANLAGEASHNRSGYLNYSAAIDGSRAWTTAGELTLSDSSKTLFIAATMDRNGLDRGLTNLTWADDVRRKEITVGDVFGDSGDLGSSEIVDGVNVARSFGSTPYAERTTSPNLSGTALTPSTADIYVNGQLIRSVDVPPGAFNFSNLPGGGGPNDAQIVLRDAFGHTQILSARYYGGDSILRMGDTDYSYSVGEGRGTAGFGQSATGLVALGRYAVGISPSTTLGGHVEDGASFENVGGSFAHGGRFGIVNGAVAESRNRGLSGLAATVAYTFAGPSAWVTASMNGATTKYVTLAERDLPDSTLVEELLDIGLRPFRNSYTTSISYSASRARLAGFTRSLTWQHTLPVGRGVSLIASTGVSGSVGRLHPTLSLFLIKSGGRASRDTTTTLSLQSEGGTVQPAIEEEQATPIAGGSGYDTTFFPSGNLSSSGRYSLRSSIGDLDADYALTRSGRLNGDVALSGAVAFVDGYAHLSQPIADGFALVKVDGGEPVDVQVDNQDYGRTDAKGFLVVPNLQSYFAEPVGVEREDGPANLDISSERQTVVVGSRRGALVAFNASVVTAVIGTVRVSHAGAAEIPSFGRLSLRVSKADVVSELDGNGRFYFENLAAGSYAATVRYAGGECRFTLAIPRLTAIEQNVGAFTCAR